LNDAALSIKEPSTVIRPSPCSNATGSCTPVGSACAASCDHSRAGGEQDDNQPAEATYSGHDMPRRSTCLYWRDTSQGIRRARALESANTIAKRPLTSAADNHTLLPPAIQRQDRARGIPSAGKADCPVVHSGNESSVAPQAAARSGAMAGEEVFVVGGAKSAGHTALYLTRYPARVHLLVRGESLTAGMSEYLITQLKAIPTCRSTCARGSSRLTATAAWRPLRLRTPVQARLNASPLPLSSS